MKRKWWIGVVALFPGFWAGAQTVKPLMAATGCSFSSVSPSGARTNDFALKPVSLFSVTPRRFPAPEPVITPVYRMAPNAYYQQHFGFFCKQEWSWQKQTGIPVKLRLGSYSYAQQQEGKH